MTFYSVVDELFLIISVSFLLSLFTLNFQNFKENAHFEDTKLKKTFTFFEEGTAKITSTYIKWNEGMVMLVYYPFSILYTFFSLIFL